MMLFACNAAIARFLLALVDPSPAVCQLAEYLLRDTLATKAPLLAYNHFVEALFVLNGCTAGLHGARLGANLVGAGGAGGAVSEGEGAAAAAAAAAGSASMQGSEEGAGEGEELSEAWMAAPVQFTLKGKHNRYVCCSCAHIHRHSCNTVNFTCVSVSFVPSNFPVLTQPVLQT
jgi:hypothetical protein